MVMDMLSHIIRVVGEIRLARGIVKLANVMAVKGKREHVKAAVFRDPGDVVTAVMEGQLKQCGASIVELGLRRQPRQVDE